MFLVSHQRIGIFYSFADKKENNRKNMNRLTLFALMALVVVFASCNRETKRFTGNYSYKLSGEVSTVNDEGTVSYRLIHKNGQMNILEDKTQSNKLIITMNEMNGGCYTITATVRGDSLLFDPYEFSTNILITENTSLFDQETASSIVYTIKSSGSGVLNGDMLLMQETWNGHQSGNESCVLTGPEMKIIAERN